MEIVHANLFLEHHKDPPQEKSGDIIVMHETPMDPLTDVREVNIEQVDTSVGLEGGIELEAMEATVGNPMNNLLSIS